MEEQVVNDNLEVNEQNILSNNSSLLLFFLMKINKF